MNQQEVEAEPGATFFDTNPTLPVSHQSEALTGLIQAVQAGQPWPTALIDAVGRWTAPQEILDGEELNYLVGGEAFDWLLLAERLMRGLTEKLPGAVPARDWERLLFTGELPLGVTPDRFKEALGVEKYRAHLNFFYGVVVEEALGLAVEREVHKEHGVRGMQGSLGVIDLVCQRLYRADHATLAKRFRRSQGRRPGAKFTLTDWNEFTYWLFKLRVGRSDAARTASDTQKGLQVLEELRGG